MPFSAVFARFPDNTLGLRLGGGFGFDWELSYQRRCSENNRMEMGLGMTIDSKNNGLTTSGTYQWVRNISGGFNWYAGPGAQMGSRGGDFYIGIHGQAGVEYIFSEIPFQIGIDTRPVIGLINANNTFEVNVNISLRYVFGR